MDLKIRNFELEILHFFRDRVSTPFLDALAQIITFLGEDYIIIVVVLLAYFVIDKQLGKTIAYVALSNLLINNTIKCIVKYPRPFTYDETLKASRVETATGYSFPSGHTQNAVGVYLTFAYNNKFKEKVRKIIWIVSICLTVLIGFSRIYLGVHYPKDVLVGALLGVGCMFLGSFLMNKFKDNFKGTLLLFLITLAIFTPFLFIFYQKDYTTATLYKDFYLIYALYAACVLGFILDEKMFDYSCNAPLWKRLVRFAVAVVVALALKEGLKIIFKLIAPNGSLFLDMARYFLMTFSVIFILPLIFKKNLFKD